MKIIRDRFGEEMPWYESAAEEASAIRAYLRQDYAELTIPEIEFLRSCERDPHGVRYEAGHAGRFAEEVDPLDFNGIVVIYDLGDDFEDGCGVLMGLIGPRPVTYLALYEAERELMR